MRFVNFFLCAVVFMTAWSIRAQENLKILNVQESTENGIGVYPCGDRHEAMVQFVTSEPFGLEFTSNMDADLQLTCDSLAGKKTYSIVFVTQAPGEDFSQRKLTVMAAGFQNHRLSLPLKDKQKLVYVVTDPYSIIRSPFFIYFEKAQDAYQEGNYQLAKDNYELCRYCPEYVNDSARVNEHLAICDSMMKWNDEALVNAHFSRYKAEAEAWQKMLRYSSNPQILSNLYAAQNNFNQDCDALARIAGDALTADNLDKAQGLYQQLLDNDCYTYTAPATAALSQIRKMRMRRNDHARTLVVMAGRNMYGLSYGNYYISRVSGWYGTLMLNLDDFDLLMQKSHVKGGFATPLTMSPAKVQHADLEQNPFVRDGLKIEKGENRNNYVPEDGRLDFEMSASFGCSWHVWEPLFLHLGLGYHGGGFCDFSDEAFLSACHNELDKAFVLKDATTWDYGFKYDYSKVNWFHGAAPELGMVLKYWRAAIKVTYQYTFWLNDRQYAEFLDGNCHQVVAGVGFCW